MSAISTRRLVLLEYTGRAKEEDGGLGRHSV